MKLILAIFFMISGSAFANCQLNIDEKYCVNMQWNEGPYIDGYSENTIFVTDINSGEKVDFASTPKFYVWMIMDMHEHGGMKLTSSHLAVGEYLNEDVYFFSGMEGIWQFRLDYNGQIYVLDSLNI